MCVVEDTVPTIIVHIVEDAHAVERAEWCFKRSVCVCLSVVRVLCGMLRGWGGGLYRPKGQDS